MKSQRAHELRHFRVRYVRCRFAGWLVLLALLLAPQIFGQESGTPATDSQVLKQEDVLDNLVKVVAAQPNLQDATNILSIGSLAPYVITSPDLPDILSKDLRDQLFHAFQDQRIDMEVTDSASASQGSTSVSNKGSVPWLLGLAVEHGAVTQSVDGNQIVLRGNIANAVSAIKYQDYVKSFQAIEEQNDLVRAVANTSFSIRYNTSSQSNNSAAIASENSTFAG